MQELIPFISNDLIKPLAKSLQRIWKKRDAELNAIYDTFGDPRPLASCYIEPRVQHHNPADHHEDEDAISYVRTPVFETINRFLNKETPLRGGRTQLFVLSDAGMGKTSLLLMFKLSHLFRFWPKRYDCLLLKLGTDTLERLRAHPNKGDTVLLLDALDEDPQAWGRIQERLVELLHAGEYFRRVIISCRTQFFPEGSADPFGRPGRVEIGGFTCPMLYLSLFDDEQVEQYLAKRFPNQVSDRLLFRLNPTRERAAELVPPMCSLRFRPLLLAHVENIIEEEQDLLVAAGTGPENGESDWDVYRIYDVLVRAWLLREERKLVHHQSTGAPTMEILRELCTLVAVHLQISGNRTLLPDELAEMTERHPALKHLKEFDLGGRSLLNRNSEGEYRFSHYSIQEFLVVRALAEETLDLAQGELSLSLLAPDSPVQRLRVLQPSQRLRLTDQMLEFLARTPVAFDPGTIDLSNIRPEARVGFAIHDRLADGSLGPAMQGIPAGSFRMGSAENDKQADQDEKPQHEVTISHAFFLGRYPVTFAEFDRFCDAADRSRPDDQGWGRGNRPVIDVSWEDAVAYCAWLSEQTGRHYRLPTEAEWEYAARAGSHTPWSFGDREQDLDPYAWSDKNSEGRTHPVGEKCPNPWGLFDCYGNVWEWTQDNWHDNYQGAPVDGSAWEHDGADARRVVRGGGWGNQPQGLRSAARVRNTSDVANFNLGFRLARTL